MKHFRFLFCAATAAWAFVCLSPAAFAQTLISGGTEGSKGGLSMAFVLLIILASCFAAMAFAVRQGRTGHANVPWAILAILLTGTALIIAAMGCSVGTVYTKPDGDPKETVIDFLNSVKTGDYPTAYGCLSDYSGLGLENIPEDDTEKAVYEALRQSYDYTIMGGATVSKLTAFVPVRVKYLDIGQLGKNVAELVNKNLEKIVESSPRNQVYDANDKYLPEVTDAAYVQAMEKLLAKSETYYTAKQINVELEYDNGQWYIVTDRELLDAIAGGTVQ